MGAWIKRYKVLALIGVAGLLAEFAAFFGMCGLRDLLAAQGHPMSHRVFEIAVGVVLFIAYSVFARIAIRECKRLEQLPKE